MPFDEQRATADELWQHYMEKYKNPHPVAKRLTEGFFNSLRRLIRTLPPNGSLLEVGCGPGASTRRICAMLEGRSLEASEFDQRLVDVNLRHDFPVRLVRESVYALQREDNAFDAVLLLEVLEHLQDPNQALEEIFRVARHGVIVSTPNEPLWRMLNFLRGKYWPDWGNTPGHINHWSSRELVKLIGNYGDVVTVRKPPPWTMVLAHKKSDRK